MLFFAIRVVGLYPVSIANILSGISIDGIQVQPKAAHYGAWAEVPRGKSKITSADVRQMLEKEIPHAVRIEVRCFAER